LEEQLRSLEGGLRDELKMARAQLAYAEFGQSRSDAELAQLKEQLAAVETELDDHRRRCDSDHVPRTAVGDGAIPGRRGPAH
jgi:predicted  nucleic acid-binding Zn-ribbon protein